MRVTVKSSDGRWALDVDVSMIDASTFQHPHAGVPTATFVLHLETFQDAGRALRVMDARVTADSLRAELLARVSAPLEAVLR